MTTILTFLVTYFLFVLFGALIILGAFSITRGKTVTLPDGSKKDVGKLFYFVLKFFTKTRVVIIPYEGVELIKIVDTLNEKYKFNLAVNSHFLAKSVIDKLRIYENIDAKVIGGNQLCLELITTEDVYSDYIKDPIICCVTCMASVWGTLIYWTSVLLYTELNVVKPVGILLLLLVWLAYMLTLAFVTTYFWTKLNK
jgi:uncharacterized membrane protein